MAHARHLLGQILLTQHSVSHSSVMAPAVGQPQNIYLATYKAQSQVLFLKPVLWTDARFGDKCANVPY